MKEQQGEDRAAGRVRWLVRGALVWAIVISGRLVQLQIVQHEELAQEAQRQQTREVAVLMPRGAILDAQDVPLALSVPGESVCVNPRRTPDVDMTARILASVLGLKFETLRKDLKEAKEANNGFLRVAPGVKPEQIERLKALGWDWVEFRPETHRVYPAGVVAAHVIGGVDHQQRGYSGVEKSLNPVLSGNAGQMLVTMDSKQRGFESHVSVQGQAGQNVRLTIDRRIQYLSERLILDAVKKNNADNGSIIVMNPHTGAVLAMANYPTIDPAAPPRDKDSPVWQNLAIEAPFEPGSVFKVVTIAAALELGRVTPETIIDCGMGQMTLFNRVIHDHVRHGVIPVKEVLAQSSNIGSIKIALMVGKERFHEYIKRFGFGERTGIELPLESRGRVFPINKWSGTSIGSVAMGHELNATTLHLAQLASTIANGGRRVRPTLIRTADNESGVVHADVAKGEQVIRPETAIKMKAMMESVVVGDHGTGHEARLDGYSSAGKTGSAQMLEKYVVNGKTKWRYSHSKYHASFMGFAPVNNPALTIVITINGATRLAGAAAAPYFRQVAQPALRMLDVPKDLPDRVLPATPGSSVSTDLAIADLAEPPQAEESEAPESSPIFIGRRAPDFRNLSMRDAMMRAQELGVDVEVRGTGVMRKQRPAAGSPLKAGEKIRLDFAR